MAGLAKQLASAGSALMLGIAMAAAHAEVVVVVSAENPVQSLTRAELADIYLGRLDRFPNGDRVVPIDQKDGSPAHDEFYEEYIGRTPAQVRAHWSKLIFTGRGQPPRSVASGDAAADAVAGNPHAIAYIDSGLVDERLRVVSIE
jgi:ABC-type phosphate transport system substrate-binding protein